MSKTDDLQAYITIAGDSLRYPRPPDEVVGFLRRVAEAAGDSTIDYSALVELVYSLENPLLVRGDAEDRGVIPLATFADPAFHVMLDLLERKRLGSASPGSDLSSTGEDRHGKVVTGGAPTGLEIRMGTEEGRSFFVKAPSFENRRRVEGGAVEAYCPRFQQVAVKLTSKRADGTKSRRMLVLEPSETPNEHAFGQFFVRGSFAVVEKINNPADAARRFRTFEPS